MTFWWLLPGIITVVVFAAAIIFARPDKYASIGQGLFSLLAFAVALIISLIAWLIYALVTP